MTCDTVIVGSHVVLPTGIIDKNIVLDEGKIIDFTNDTPSSDRKINADGLVAIPGVIDTHVHYGVYSPIEHAAMSESHAAAIGGITTMMRMLRRGDSYKNSLSPQLNASSKSHYVDYAIHASIFNSQQVDEMQYCVENGVTSFKLYMNLGGEVGHVYMDMEPGKNLLQEERVEVTSEIVEKVVKNASSLGCPVLVHAEDYEQCGCGIKKAKEKNQDGLDAWSESRPTKSEIKSIQTISKFARDSNCVLYFAHIGSHNALEQISEERKNGTKIFVETCPHYLTLSHENQEGYLAKVMPPIRSESDVLSVWNAINQNHVNTMEQIMLQIRLNSN